MLAANPNLEILKFDSKCNDERTKIDKKKLPNVHLPKLRSVSFLNVASAFWTRRIIKMLEAPNITSFELILDELAYDYHRPGDIRKLLGHISGNANQATPVPRFPSLKCLTLSPAMAPGFEEEILPVVAAHPLITELYLPFCPNLSPLCKRPWLAPELQILRVGRVDPAQLKKMVKSRGKAGPPLHTVFLDHGRFQVPVKASAQAQLRKYVKFEILLNDSERVDDGD